MFMNILSLTALFLACETKENPTPTDTADTTNTTDSGQTNSDSFTQPTAGEWIDESPSLVSDNCDLAYENPNQQELGIMYIDISAVQSDTFTITFPWENDVEWQENETAPTATCSWTSSGDVSCNNPEYMNKSLEEYFAGDTGLEGLSGTMIGSLEVQGNFSDNETFNGTIKNIFDCQGGDCEGMEVPNPCVLEKSFSVVLTNLAEE